MTTGNTVAFTEEGLFNMAGIMPVECNVHPVVLFSIVDSYERRTDENARVIGTLLGMLPFYWVNVNIYCYFLSVKESRNCNIWSGLVSLMGCQILHHFLVCCVACVHVWPCMLWTIWIKVDYTPIAFDERVTFWLQRAQSLPCACAFAALYACAIA